MKIKKLSGCAILVSMLCACSNNLPPPPVPTGYEVPAGATHREPGLPRPDADVNPAPERD